ncbi:MAG: hypothetical protein LBL66_10660 [Clostridiales bacterium]|nr:hypothetical protein [Clostridiales bacterium]
MKTRKNTRRIASAPALALALALVLGLSLGLSACAPTDPAGTDPVPGGPAAQEKTFDDDFSSLAPWTADVAASLSAAPGGGAKLSITDASAGWGLISRTFEADTEKYPYFRITVKELGGGVLPAFEVKLCAGGDMPDGEVLGRVFTPGTYTYDARHFNPDKNPKMTLFLAVVRYAGGGDYAVIERIESLETLPSGVAEEIDEGFSDVSGWTQASASVSPASGGGMEVVPLTTGSGMAAKTYKNAALAKAYLTVGVKEAEFLTGAGAGWSVGAVFFNQETKKYEETLLLAPSKLTGSRSARIAGADGKLAAAGSVADVQILLRVASGDPNGSAVFDSITVSDTPAETTTAFDVLNETFEKGSEDDWNCYSGMSVDFTNGGKFAFTGTGQGSDEYSSVDKAYANVDFTGMKYLKVEILGFTGANAAFKFADNANGLAQQEIRVSSVDAPEDVYIPLQDGFAGGQIDSYILSLYLVRACTLTLGGITFVAEKPEEPPKLPTEIEELFAPGTESGWYSAGNIMLDFTDGGQFGFSGLLNDDWWSGVSKTYSNVTFEGMNYMAVDVASLTGEDALIRIGDDVNDGHAISGYEFNAEDVGDGKVFYIPLTAAHTSEVALYKLLISIIGAPSGPDATVVFNSVTYVAEKPEEPTEFYVLNETFENGSESDWNCYSGMSVDFTNGGQFAFTGTGQGNDEYSAAYKVYANVDFTGMKYLKVEILGFTGEDAAFKFADNANGLAQQEIPVSSIGAPEDVYIPLQDGFAGGQVDSYILSLYLVRACTLTLGGITFVAEKPPEPTPPIDEGGAGGWADWSGDAAPDASGGYLKLTQSNDYADGIGWSSAQKTFLVDLEQSRYLAIRLRDYSGAGTNIAVMFNESDRVLNDTPALTGVYYFDLHDYFGASEGVETLSVRVWIIGPEDGYLRLDYMKTLAEKPPAASGRIDEGYDADGWNNWEVVVGEGAVIEPDGDCFVLRQTNGDSWYIVVSKTFTVDPAANGYLVIDIAGVDDSKETNKLDVRVTAGYDGNGANNGYGDAIANTTMPSGVLYADISGNFKGGEPQEITVIIWVVGGVGNAVSINALYTRASAPA